MASKWYGSLDNRISENVLQPIPTVGMGATETLWSDRHAYTILEVSKETIKHTMQVKGLGEVTREYPKWIKASRDNAKLISGPIHSEAQKYEYSNDGKIEDAKTYYFHKGTSKYREENKTWKDGEYKGTKRTTQERQCILLGYRDEYFDPCF